MLSINELTMNKTDCLVERFLFCVAGELNAESLSFLHSLNKANPSGLTDLISKLQNLCIQVEADTIDRVIDILNMQLPYNTLQTIHDFLSDDNKHRVYQELRALIQGSKPQQSINYMLDKLKILAEKSSADQFIRTLICIILEWSSDLHRSLQEAATWLKNILNLPITSPLAQLIQIIADLLQLSDSLITGKTRNMDALELFFMLKNVTANTDLLAASEAHKKLMQQVHAAILTSMIYKNSPHAFYDLVWWHQKHPEFSILTNLHAQNSEPLLLEQFLHQGHLKPYFPQQRYQNEQINQHIFLASLASYIQTAVKSKNQSSDLDNILNFAQECVTAFQQKDKKSFMQWFQNHVHFEDLESNKLSVFFHLLLSLATTQKSHQMGRIRARAMQLVALGFSHRSAATQATGAFIPLVNIDIARIDVENINALIAFFNQQTSAQRLKLLQEIFLNYVLCMQIKRKPYPGTLGGVVKKDERLTTIKASSFKPTVAKVFRENPLDRNRLFTNPVRRVDSDIEAKAAYRKQ